MNENARLCNTEEVKDMLPLLRSITANIKDMWQTLLTKKQAKEMLEKKEGVAPEEIDELKLDMNNDIDRMNAYIQEIEKLGGYVEEFNRGIINFPILVHQRRVFLCVKPTEEEDVLYYHDLDEVYQDRRLIPTPIETE